MVLTPYHVHVLYVLLTLCQHCSLIQATLRDPLPPVLAKMDEMPRDRYFETTNGKVHDRKFLGGPYGNGKSNVYKKAPALYNVKYVKDHAEKVSSKAPDKRLSSHFYI